MRITRRQLGLAMAATAAAQNQKSTYAGPLAGTDVDLKAFDPVQWTLERHDSAPLKLTFRAENRKQAEAWQKKLRAKVVELMGGFPEHRGDLHARSLGVSEIGGRKREKFVFESRPGVGVLVYLITPANARGPLPAVVCIPGHGRGV